MHCDRARNLIASRNNRMRAERKFDRTHWMLAFAPAKHLEFAGLQSFGLGQRRQRLDRTSGALTIGPFKHLLRRLWWAGSHEPSTRCRAHRDRALRTCAARAATGGLSASSGSANDAQRETRGECGQIGHHLSSIRAITAFELPRLPAYASQDVGQRTAAIAAAPAVNQRLPVFRLRFELRLQMMRDVARDVGGTAPTRLE